MSAWYESSFGEDYLIVYKHRDIEGAYLEVKRMMDWLALPQGATVLDFCCGMGRHALALTEFGYEVTGVDLSNVLLKEARQLDDQQQVRWLQGDMRNVPLNESFDAVVNLFTSFGYFESDEENGRVIHEINRLLKPGGKFIIDFLNAAFVQERLVPESHRAEYGLDIYESRRIENGFVKKKIRIVEAGSKEREYDEQVKLYGLTKMENFIRETGLRIDKVYGSYDATPYEEHSSPRLIIVGHKA